MPLLVKCEIFTIGALFLVHVWVAEVGEGVLLSIWNVALVTNLTRLSERFLCRQPSHEMWVSDTKVWSFLTAGQHYC